MWKTSSGYFLEKIMQTVSDNPSLPYSDLLVQKAKTILSQREIDRKLKEDEAGALPDSPLEVNNRAYFRYLLNVSFHQAYSYQRSLSIGSYLGAQFAYAKNYAKNLLSFDDASGKCTQNRNITLAFSEDDQLEIEFHLYHVSYRRNQQPIYAPFIHFSFIADQSDDGIFWILLPLTFVHVDQEVLARQEIEGRLAKLGFFEDVPCEIIADCLTMMICKNYEEEFYPAQLTIYEESLEQLYFSEIYLNEGVFLIGKRQVNAWREVLRNESYAVGDVNSAIAFSHRLLSEYTQPFSLETLQIDRMPNTVLHGFNHKKQQCLKDEEVTFDGIRMLLADFLDGKLERLELFWQGQERVMKGIPSRSLVFLKVKPFMGNHHEYACFCFDHLEGYRFMLLSYPEIYQGDSENVKYASFNAGQTATYNIHQNTERIGQFLNKAIAQVSDLTKEVPHNFDMWSLEVYYNSKKSYELDMYLLGGFAYECVAEKLSRNFQFYYYPEYMEVKTLDGQVTTHEMKIKNSFVVKQHLREFLAEKLAKLRLTWSWKKQGDSENQNPATYHTHILLLHDDGKYMLIFFDDHRQCLYHLVYDKEAYTADKKRKAAPFLGVKHEPYLIHHDLDKIKESLSLLLPSISHPEGLLHLWAEYAYCSEMKVGKTIKNYEEIKALYFE